MRVLAVAVGLSVLGSLGGLLTASSLLLFHDSVHHRLLPWLISYAVGTLLGISLLALVPEALSQMDPRVVLGTLLTGILVFFGLEKLVLWRHCHTEACEVHDSAAALVIVGDTVHNFIDGALIGAATLTSVPLGVTTAIAVAAHEIPQEVGDFAILLSAGYSRRRALQLNLYSGLAAAAGAAGMFLAVDQIPPVLTYAIPFAAGGFLYVAMSDLIPGLHRVDPQAGPARQLLLILAGIATVVVLDWR